MPQSPRNPVQPHKKKINKGLNLNSVTETEWGWDPRKESGSVYRKVGGVWIFASPHEKQQVCGNNLCTLVPAIIMTPSSCTQSNAIQLHKSIKKKYLSLCGKQQVHENMYSMLNSSKHLSKGKLNQENWEVALSRPSLYHARQEVEVLCGDSGHFCGRKRPSHSMRVQSWFSAADSCYWSW